MPTVYLTAASGSWTVPAGVTSLKVECLGAGGRAIAQNVGGPGGGGYSCKNSLSVSPGQVITYQVGRSSTGSDTWFSSSATVLAKSGASPSGYSGSGSQAGAQGGQAASGVGDIKYSGGNGGGGMSTGGGGGGGAAGPSGNGSNGSNAGGYPSLETDYSGAAGGAAGGPSGGTGGVASGGAAPGGNGGNGSGFGGGYGSGGGGAGGNFSPLDAQAFAGGSGGNYGGAAGGNPTTPDVMGGDGLIVITYTVTASDTSGIFSVM